MKQYNTGYENTSMHHAIVFSYTKSDTQGSDMLDMLKFLKISITKCSHHLEITEKLLGFTGSDWPNKPNLKAKDPK